MRRIGIAVRVLHGNRACGAALRGIPGGMCPRMRGSTRVTVRSCDKHPSYSSTVTKNITNSTGTIGHRSVY